MASIKEYTIKSVKWSAIEKFSVHGIQFVLGLIMARLLLPSDYGVVGMLAIFFAISSTFIDSGFGNALIRKLDRTEEDFSTVFYFNITVSGIIYLLLFFCAPIIADFFNTPIISPILRVQAITLVINSLIGIHNTKLIISLNFKVVARINILATTISGVVGVICAYCSMGVWALVVQNVLSSILTVIFMLLCIRWKPLLKFSIPSFKELGLFGSKLLVSSLLHTLYANLTTLIIGKYFSANDLGYYTRGTNFATLPVNTINDVVRKVLYPILVNIQNDDDHLIIVYRKYLRILSLPIFFGCILLASIAKPLILILLTPKWAEAIIYLQIFAFAIMFDHVCSINLELLIVKGRSDLFLRLEFIKKTISVAILFASIPFGVIGICVSKIIYTQIAVFINTFYTRKLFHLGYITQMKDFLGYFFLSILACLPGYLLCTFTGLPNIITLMFGLIVGIILFMFFVRKDVCAIEIYDLFVSKFSFLPKRK